MALDLTLARALRSAHVLERALAEHRGWAFHLGDTRVPATREIGSDGVVFRATIPEFVTDPDAVILCWAGQMQLAAPYTGTPGETLTWELRLPETVSV